MTMDVSSLGIEVKSTGIKEASSALSGLGTAAANAETKVNKLTDAVERLLKQNVTATMQAWAASMNAMSSAMNSVGSGAQGYAMALTSGSNASQQAASVTNTLNQQFNNQANVLVNLTNNVNNYAAATNRAATEAGGFASRTGVMLNTLKAMTAAFLYYQSINLAKSIVHDADEFTNMNAKLVVSTGSQQNATLAMRDMFNVSQQLRTSFESTAELFARMNLIMQRTGHGYEEVKTTVTGLAAALHLYGATTGESSSAMLAYAHSASTGVVHMRTLNSLMTSAPLLLQAFQDATGKSGEELRKMSTKGQLTFEMLNQALANATPKFLAQFDRIPITFAGAMQRLENAWLYSIGKMGQDTGFNTSMAEALRTIEKMIPAIAQGLGNAFVSVIQWIDKNQDGIKEVLNQTGLLIKDVWEIGKGILSWSAEVTDAKDSMSLFAGVLLTVRLSIAAIKDALMAIAGVLIAFGAIIIATILAPFQLVAGTIGYIADGMAKLDNMAARSALAKGNKEQYEALSKQAEVYTSVSDSMHNFNTSTKDAESHVLALGEAWAVAGAKGASALAVMNPKTIAKPTNDIAGFTTLESESHYDEVADLAAKRAAALRAAAEAAGAKAAEAAQKEANKQAEAIARLNTEYNKLLAIQQALQEGSAGVKVGPAQEEYLRLQQEIKANLKENHGLVSKAMIDADLQQQLAKAAVNAELERYNELIQKGDASDKKELDHQTALTAVLKTQLESLEKRNAAFKNPMGKEDLTNTKADALAAGRDAAQGNLDNVAFVEAATTAEIENQQKLVKVYQDQIDVLDKIAIAQHIASQNSLTTEWDKLFDDKKATKFTDAMVKGFGSAGKAVAGVANAMRTMAENQDKVNKALQIAKDTDKGALKNQREADAVNLALQMQMDNYANLSKAAQGFFDKGTVGYKLMGDAEKTFRLTEMAMALENFAVKTGLMNSETVLAIAGYVKTAIASQESAAVQVASALGLGPVLAALGVATQAQGDPYTAWGRMAAMVAAMAALGFVVSGGGGGASAHIAADRQASAGTGTTLGDATKQSESISKSISLLASNSDIGLRYSEGMLSALQSIQSALAGTANQILQSGGNLTGSSFSGSSMPVVASMVSGLKTMFQGGLGGLGSFLHASLSGSGIGSTKSLVDSGITSGNQSVGSVLGGGFSASAYQDIETKNKAFFITYSDSLNRHTSALDSTVTNSFTNIIKGMATAVTSAGVALGMSSDEIQAKIKAVTISLGDISLKGLTGDQIEKQLETVFSAFGDKLASAGLGTIVTKFQQAGEGLLQTAVRVASGVDTASVELNKLGLTAVAFSDIINTNGDIGAEIVRQSIMVKEAGSGIGEIISTMSGAAGDIGSTYTSLLALRTSLVDLGIAKDVTRDLINAAGGMSTFQSALDSYKKNFFSSAEQNAMSAGDLSKQFAALGLTMPRTKADFRSLVEALSASGATGQATAAKVILLSDAFSGLSSTVDDAVSTATSNLTDSYNNQVNVLTTAKTAFDGFAASLKTFKQSLMTGDLSTLSGLQKYQAEKTLYETTQAKAAAGDQKALADFQQIATDFLTASRGMYASGDQYTADYQQVSQQTDSLQQYSAAMSSVQDQQLAALQQQVSGLITINSSVLTVAQAIDALQTLIATGVSGGTSAASVVAGDSKSTILPVTDSKSYQQSVSSDTAALATQVKALQDEIAGMRADAAAHAGMIATAVVTSASTSADTIVEGTQSSNTQAAYAARAKVAQA